MEWMYPVQSPSQIPAFGTIPGASGDGLFWFQVNGSPDIQEIPVLSRLLRQNTRLPLAVQDYPETHGRFHMPHHNRPIEPRTDHFASHDSTVLKQSRS